MANECNKDEAQRCFHIAKKALKEGDSVKAEKLLVKADKLYPTPETTELLARVRSQEHAPPKRSRRISDRTGSNNANAHPTSGAKGSGNSGSKVANGGGNGAISAQSSNGDGTAEPSGSQRITSNRRAQHIESIRRMETSMDFYEIFGVSRDASDDDIKDGYKKLALLLHPDKNKQEGATEAFQALEEAQRVLLDPVERKKYDHKLQEMAREAEREAREAETRAREAQQYQARANNRQVAEFNFDTPMKIFVIGTAIVLTGLLAKWFWDRRKEQNKDKQVSLRKRRGEM